MEADKYVFEVPPIHQINFLPYRLKDVWISRCCSCQSIFTAGRFVILAQFNHRDQQVFLGEVRECCDMKQHVPNVYRSRAEARRSIGEYQSRVKDAFAGKVEIDSAITLFVDGQGGMNTPKVTH